jgi:cell division protein ZapE
MPAYGVPGHATVTRSLPMPASLDQIIAQLQGRPDTSALLARLVPPPRFAGKRLQGYHPDPDHPSQGAARDRVAGFAGELHQAGWRRLLARREGGLYLDGGFGVGKTHLLASLWQEAPAPKAYLRFDDLVHLIGLLGLRAAGDALAGHRLVCVDEWELDDPGNLRMAVGFLRIVVPAGVRLAVTSNTLPAELGSGRLAQKEFLREIDEMARAFEVVRILGDDYRHRHFEARPGDGYLVSEERLEELAAGPPAMLRVEQGELLRALGRVHPIRFGEMALLAPRIAVRGLAPLPDLAAGLRWVHWIDELYDAGGVLAASGEASLDEFFPTGALTGPYARKFGRCLSRMEELLGETAEGAGAGAPGATPEAGSSSASP